MQQRLQRTYGVHQYVCNAHRDCTTTTATHRLSAPERCSWFVLCRVLRDSITTTLSQQDPEKSNITVGFFIVLYRIWALFTGTNKDKILSRALFEIFIKIDGLYPFFQCRFYWVFWKSFLTAYLNSWWNFHSFDRSHYIILSKNAISHF